MRVQETENSTINFYKANEQIERYSFHNPLILIQRVSTFFMVFS